MSLTELTVENLRCLERVELRLHPGHNLIWGGNGSGKTSLLEAAFLLGGGRSVRTRSSERPVRHGRAGNDGGYWGGPGERAAKRWACRCRRATGRWRASAALRPPL